MGNYFSGQAEEPTYHKATVVEKKTSPKRSKKTSPKRSKKTSPKRSKKTSPKRSK